jgi:serine/threonine protein kinase
MLRMAKEAKLATGQKFGQWTLSGGEPLGKGGNGVVWAAVNEAGERAAIKFLHKNHFTPPAKRFARFRDEVTFLKQEAGRSGLLPLLDANIPQNPSAENRPWFATPMATPFSKLSLSGATNLPVLAKKIEKIARTLAGLHTERKFHRDLKPDNLFDLNDNPVIGDHGLVDFPGKEAVTEATEILGPLFYIAPEMMENAETVEAGPADV